MRLIDADELPVTCTLKAINGEIAVTGWIEAERINEAPTIEAIPIEWLKDWRKEKWFDRRLSMEERMVRAMVARMIVEDWEDENGRENN